MKKKSLIVAAAMLLVAIIAATGTTYAWFTSNNDASASVSMSVSNGQSLEIQKKNAGDDKWFTSLSATELGIDTNQTWQDYTYTNKFYTKTTASGKTDVTGATEATPISVTISVRSTYAGSANVSLALNMGTESTAKQKIMNNARVSVLTGGQYTHLGTTEGTYKLADGTTDPSGLSPNYNISDSASIALTASGDYYVGEATFYFWLEGTALTNHDVKTITDQLAATLTFAYAAPSAT